MEKIEHWIQKAYRILEVVVALLMLLGIIMAIFSLLTDYTLFYELTHSTDAFKEYIDKIFVIVIGIEFLQMLSRPNSKNVIEAIIFLVARHMIVSHTTPFEDFISVLSIVILCIVRRYLQTTTDKNMNMFKKKQEKEEIDNK